MSVCKECYGENYILLGCCSGRECGCLGQPVQMINCKECNPDGSKPMGDYVKPYSEHVEYIGTFSPDLDQLHAEGKADYDYECAKDERLIDEFGE